MNNDKSSFFSKVNNLRSVLFMDRHHKIHQQAFGFAMLTVLLVVSLIIGGATAFKSNADLLGTKAVYTTNFSTSKTDNKGTVEGVYRNSAGNRAMVLMKFADPGKMSADPANYRVFATGAKPSGPDEKLKNGDNLKASLVSFGSTGYMGVILESAEGFAPQITNLTFRSLSEISETKDVKLNPEEGYGESFSKFDQWRVYANFGAKDAKVTKALDDKEINASDMFYELVIKPEENEARAQLNKTLSDMSADLNAIKEYRERLEGSKINDLTLKMPEDPEEIRGDAVECLDEGASDNGGGDCKQRKLVTGYIVNGGYHFNWQESNVQKGYLKRVVPDEESYITFLNERASLVVPNLNIDAVQWVLSDDSLLSTYDAESLPPVKAMNENITLLTTAWETYYKDKTAYERDQVEALLRLEVMYKDVAENATVNDSAGVLSVY